jgi:hypothetical protein
MKMGKSYTSMDSVLVLNRKVRAKSYQRVISIATERTKWVIGGLAFDAEANSISDGPMVEQFYRSSEPPTADTDNLGMFQTGNRAKTTFTVELYG